MKETVEDVEEASWNEIGLERGDYFSPERDRPYIVVVSAAQLVKDPKYLDKDGKPKLKCVIKIASIDGKPTTQKWTTGSWSVMREIKKCLPVYGDGSLSRSTFLLKMREEAGKKMYVFEKTGEVSSPPAKGVDEVGAYI